MSSTFTANNGIEKPGTGEQTGTWGATVDANYDLQDSAIDGSVAITLSSTTATLPVTNGVASNGRFKVVRFTGSPGGTCTVTVTPNTAQKIHFIVNASNQSVIITQGSGSTVTIAAGSGGVAYCDGTGSTANVRNALPLNTDLTAEGATNKFYTDARVRAAITATAPLAINSGTGVISIPAASGSQAGALASADWTIFNNKEPAIATGLVTDYVRGDKTIAALTTDAVPEGARLYYTDGRARSAITVTGAGATYNSSTGLLTVPGGGGGGGAAAWGTITGTLASQTDLNSALGAKEPSITTGTTGQFWRGDKSFQTLDTAAVPENTNQYFTNARARAALSATGSGGSYNSSTGVITFSANGGATVTWAAQGSSGSVLKDHGYFVTANAIILTLPSGSTGDTVSFISELTGVQTFTINPAGGQTIQGDSTLIVDVIAAGFDLVLHGTDWRVKT